MVLENENIYDLVVIGGGPAGTPIVMEYGNLNPNKKILLIDKKGELGGECLFDGCIPSKILESSGNILNLKKKFNSIGINSDNFSFDWNKIIIRKKEILQRRTKAAKEVLDKITNINLIKGKAKFISKNKIQIIDENNQIIEISFKKAVIATGSRTYIPNFQGNGLNKIWTNDIFFDKMELPKNLTIIGDGPIGIELSQFLSNLGVKINLIGNKEIILPMIEEKYSNIILNKLKENENLNLILNVDIKTIDYNNENDNFKLDYLYKRTNEIKSITSSRVLIATGRSPNIEELNLNNANVKYENRGIIINEYLQTSNKNIYALGDVALKFPQFAHSASYGAHILSQNLFFNRNKFKIDFFKNSWVLFSNPNFAQAGLSENKAIELGHDILVGEYEFSTNAKSQIELEDEGYLKFVVNKKNLQIIGISILNKSAHSIAGEASLIISNKNTLLDIINSIHPHPTISESYVFLAKQMMGDIMKERMKNPLFKIGFLIKKYF